MLARALSTSLILLTTTPAAADPVDELIRQYMEVSHIPGAAVAIVDDGVVEKMKGYGFANLEWRGEVTPDTPFQLASATKIFTGVILMRLSEQGVVGLDDPLTRYFPEAPETWKQVTLRQLASHMSGMPERLGLPDTASPQDFAAAAMTRPLAYTPGSESRYGFTDYIVLTAALEKATRLSFADIVQREITTPLGLTNTGFSFETRGAPLAPSQVQRRASLYSWNGAEQDDDTFVYMPYGYSAGGLYSSVRDLATLFTAIDGGQYLSAESFRALTTAAPLSDGRPGGFAIGWTADQYRGQQVYGHSGGPALADILHVPSERLTIIALANQRQFFPLLAQSIADTELAPIEPRPTLIDERPALTASVAKALATAGDGRLDKAAFTTTGGGSHDFLSNFGRALLTAVGPLQGLDLLSEATDGDGFRRSYRARFERRDVVWIVRTDAQGLFNELRPGGETD
ncbi:serine hydrolase domain-containing protein [Brevundimonas sp. NPDC092305]|uniref:serine hydrolase domain-containing protein n=1 Tax=Brevundimonas sp. NPDC092305 TaxID=3363957 RepID=UPI00381E8663